MDPMCLFLKSHTTKEFSALEQDQDAAWKRFLIPCSSPVHQVRCFKRHLGQQGQTPVPIVLWGCYTQRAIHFHKLKKAIDWVFPPNSFHHYSSPNVNHTLIYWWLFSASSPVVSSFPWQHCIWLQSLCEPTHFSFWSVPPPWPSRGGEKTGWAARHNDPLLIISINSNLSNQLMSGKWEYRKNCFQ